MGFSFDFTDNKSISAQELNSVIAEVGNGTVGVSSQFVEDTLYYTDKLNCIRSEIVTGGVKSGCEGSLCTEGVLIGEGICFFDNGIRIKIDSEGIKLPIASGVENFVYLYASPMVNIATAVVVTEKKTGNEYIPICKINSDGSLIDERKWCMSKIPMMNSRFVQIEKMTIHKPSYIEELMASFKIINTAYSYIVFTTYQAMAMYTRDTGKFSYIITDGSDGRGLIENANYFYTGLSSGNVSSSKVRLEESNGMINLYGSGFQVEREMTAILL